MSDEVARGELQEYLAGLEEERRKVEAFKRELPLCMQLLTDAIQSTQAQLQADDVAMDSEDVSDPHPPRDRTHYSHRPIPSRPAAAEVSSREPDTFAPPPPFPRAGGPAWLSEAISQRAVPQSSAEGRGLEQRMEGLGPPLAERGPGRPARDGGEEAGALPPLFRSPGAFLPFSREQHSPQVVRPLSPHVLSYPLAMHLQHSSMPAQASRENDDSPASVLEERRSQAAAAGPSDTEAGHSGEGTATANDATGSSGALSRKQRRCWSPELHRRFVNALNQLGGSQVATPKQIRELMKVDGLTNDEVKSHLQKYRLHTRRPSPIPTTAPGPGPGQVVVLGSIWVPPEYSAAASTAAALYDAAAAVAAAPSQGAPNAPPGTPLDEHRVPPGAPGPFHPSPFFQVLGGRPIPSTSGPELTLAPTGNDNRSTLSQGDVKEARGSFGGFRLFEAPESNRSMESREDTGGSSHRRGGSMSEDSSDAGRGGEQDGSSEGRGVQSTGPHAFRTFLPPRPDASAHRA